MQRLFVLAFLVLIVVVWLTRSARARRALWVILVGGVGVGLYLWVTSRHNAGFAYDTLTQRQSPIGPNLGTAELLLSIFGYFLAPPTLGALAAAAYVAHSSVSPRAKRRADEAALRKLKGLPEPGLLAKLFGK